MQKVTSLSVPAILFSAVFTMLCVADDKAALQSTEPYVHQGKQYPPVLFQTNIEENSYKQQFDSFEAFTKLDNEAVGLPIGVRVLKGLSTKSDAKSFSSAILSGSTLGLIPLVSNKDFKVRYDVFVQGKSIAKYEYVMTSSEVENMWGAGRTDLKPAEQQFLELTINKFLTDVQENQEIIDVFNEYDEYFGAL